MKKSVPRGAWIVASISMMSVLGSSPRTMRDDIFASLLIFLNSWSSESYTTAS